MDTDVFFFLECSTRWEEKTLPSIPPHRRALITRFCQDTPRSRPQLIRRPSRLKRDGRDDVFYIAVTKPGHEHVLEFDLRDTPLGSIHLERALAGEHPKARRVTEPLHFVCTHGKRDRCCALYGMEVFNAMIDESPETVWQTSHLGGHRFAATSLSLPHGYAYGRLSAADGRELVRAHRYGELGPLKKLRGRTCYSSKAQVVEIALRERHGETTPDALRFVGEEGDRVTFRVGVGVDQLPVESIVGPDRMKSCGKAPEPLVSLRAR